MCEDYEGNGSVQRDLVQIYAWLYTCSEQIEGYQWTNLGIPLNKFIDTCDCIFAW